MANTLYVGVNDKRFWHQSGQFTSTVKASIHVNSIISGSAPNDVSYDGFDVAWADSTTLKLVTISGIFSSTIHDSQSSGVTQLHSSTLDHDNISWSGWSGAGTSKLYLNSGKITSTILSSVNVSSTDTTPNGLSYDGTNSPWLGQEAAKAYLQSGQHTSTTKTSQSVSALMPNGQRGISWTGLDTMLAGYQLPKLYITSGQFTSTVKDSYNVSAFEAVPQGIDTDDIEAKIGEIPVTAVADITLPVMVMSASASGVDGADITFPVLTLNAFTPGISTASSSIILPVFTIGGFAFATISSGIGAITFPIIGIESTVLQGEVGTFANALFSLGLGLSIRAHKGSAPKCVVMNTKNLAVSEYVSYGFNSMTEFDGVYLIADQNGIYVSDNSDSDNAGVDDYAIKAHIKTGRIDIHKNNKNKLANAWINYQTDGSIQMVSTGDKKATRTYLLPYHSGLSGINERRVKFERGIRNRFFDFKIQNIIGSQLEIDKLTIMLEPVVSKRR